MCRQVTQIGRGGAGGSQTREDLEISMNKRILRRVCKEGFFHQRNEGIKRN